MLKMKEKECEREREKERELSVHCDWYVSEGQGSFHWTRKAKK